MQFLPEVFYLAMATGKEGHFMPFLWGKATIFILLRPDVSVRRLEALLCRDWHCC